MQVDVARHARLGRLVSGCSTGMPIEGEKCKEAARIGLVTVDMQSLKLTFPALFSAHYAFYLRSDSGGNRWYIGSYSRVSVISSPGAGRRRSLPAADRSSSTSRSRLRCRISVLNRKLPRRHNIHSVKTTRLR